MKIDVKKLIIILAIMFVLTPLTTVSARRGSDDSSSSSSQSQENETETETENEVEKETETEKQEVENRREKIQEKINNRSQEIEKENKDSNKKKKTPEELAKKCSERKNGLETKLSRLVSNAEKHQAKISAYLDKIVAYKIDNSINDPSVDDAIIAATDAKTTSEASTTALAALSPTIDCNSGTVASDVAQFKAAAEVARTNLRSYRKAVKSVHTAIENIADKTDDTSTEGQQ